MANEVEIVVTGTDRTGAMFASIRGQIAGLSRSFGGLRTSIKTTLDGVQTDVHTGLSRSIESSRTDSQALGRTIATGIKRGASGIDRDGSNLGKRLMYSIADSINQSKSSVHQAFSNTITSVLPGVLSTPVIGPIIAVALAGVATAIAPVLASAIGGSLILGFGSGMLGLVTAALLHTEEIDKNWSKSEQKRVAESNKQAEKIKHQWLETTRYVINGIKEISQPLIPVMDTVRGQIKSVGHEFKPILESVLAMGKVPLQSFAKKLGEGIKELGPAIKPVMESFYTILDTIGPMLPGIFKDMADALIDLSGVMIENRDLFGAVFYAMAESVPVAISAIANLISFFRTLMQASAEAYAYVVSGVLEVADGVLAAVQSMYEGLAGLGGPFAENLKGPIASLKETRAEIQGMIGDAKNVPKIIKLRGDIADLEGKLNSAKRQLKDPNLTKSRKAKLNAEISQLQSAIWRAKQALASVQGKTVTIFVKTEVQSDLSRAALRAATRAHGGVVGGGISAFAQGGVAGAGGATALVGEHGPELVRLPYGSTVIPAGQTRAMAAAQSGAATGGRVSTTFQSASASLVEVVKKVIEALKEVITLRDAMGKLTGSMFGQQRALMAYESAWDDALKSLKKHKQTLNIHTEAGRANRQSLLSIAEAAHEVVFQMDEAGKSSTSMFRKMKEQRAEFIKMARSMGLSSKAARKLADDYGLIPSKVKKAADAEDRAVRQNKAIEKRNKANGFAAAGGPRSGLTLVGELGPELVRLPFGSSVMPAGQTEGVLGAPGGGGAGILHITLQIGTATLGELIIDPLRKSVRTRGGNVQAVLGKG